MERRKNSGPSFSDMPNSILVNILLRLSIRKIFLCKCVCKTWYDLISDPHFAKLHFDQGQVCPLIQASGFILQSRMLYLVQPDDFDKCFEDRSRIKIKLDCKLKLPVRNIEMVLDQEGVENQNCMNMKKHRYNIVNSCNGLLCLSDPSNDDPVVVCNPVTGEFINLPEVRTANDFGLASIKSGFGFSPRTNQYKVIRMYANSNINYDTVAEVHVLGTESWKDFQVFPRTNCTSPTYFNGCVYWFSPGKECFVVSFDIEKECFELISTPPEVSQSSHLVEIGVLGGELFISKFFDYNCLTLNFWAMKDNGAEKSWSPIFSFQGSDHGPCGAYKPITYLNNGTLFMSLSQYRAFICKHPEKKGCRYFNLSGVRSKVEVIPHIPSFLSLKHALSGHNVEVLNVKSRLKLHGEGKVISIVGDRLWDKRR